MKVRARSVVAALAAIVVLATAAAAGVVANGDNGRSPAPAGSGVLAEASSPDPAYALLEPCVADGADIDPDCLERTLLESIRTWGPAESMAALARHIERRPEVDLSCHPIAHAAGSLAFELAGGKDPAQLMLHGNTTCGLGFIHGVLDALGESGASREELLEVALACDEGALALTGHCHDGIGHAAWNATKDVDASVRICQGLNTESARRLCGGGILMQMFEPANLEGIYPKEEAARYLPGICASWPDYLPDDALEDPRSACWIGASYLYALAVTDAHWAAGSPDVLEDLPRWQAMVGQASDNCSLFGSEEAWRACAVAIGLHTGGPMARFDPERATALCGGLPERFVEECAQGAGVRAGRHTEIFNPDGTLAYPGPDSDHQH